MVWFLLLVVRAAIVHSKHSLHHKNIKTVWVYRLVCMRCVLVRMSVRVYVLECICVCVCCVFVGRYCLLSAEHCLCMLSQSVGQSELCPFNPLFSS